MSTKLSTRNLPERNGVSKTLSPGNVAAYIADITMDAPVYDQNAYNVNLHLVGEDLGADFEGFLVDKNDPQGPRYKGQVGRVRLSQYAFSDGETKTGRKISRDQSILSAFQALADGLGLKEEINGIDADTIEDFVDQAKELFISDTDLKSFCISGKEYTNKEGYINHDLFVSKNDFKLKKFSVVEYGNEEKLVTYDAAVHIIKKKAAATVEAGFKPAVQSDFDL